MTYEAWMKLSEEEQENVPDSDLPEIPPEMLENKLTKAVCKRMDGVLGWETTQTVRNGSNTRWFPMYQMKLVQGQEFWYKFNPICGLYDLNLTGAEPTLEEEPIGKYGMLWMEFMKEQHPHLVEMMKLQNQFLTVARSVERSAWKYREILERDYQKMNPRPQTDSFEEQLRYNRAMDFYTDSTVMRERVLIPVTKP